MKFLLSSNEGLICLLIESDVSKNSSCNKRPYLFDLNKLWGTDGSMNREVVGGLSVTAGVFIWPR